jgi:hypothetical protein
MSAILDAFSRALRDLFNLRVLWVAIWPMLVAGLLWLVLGVTFWTTFSGWIVQGIGALGAQHWLEQIEPVWIAGIIQALLHIMLFVPLVYLTALVITALFGMTALIRLVAERDYPALKRETGGSFVGGLWNALIAVGLFMVLWGVTLPLWLIGIGVVVPFIAAAYLNQRLFRYDALAEHASADEMATLFENDRAGWWGLGLLTGLVHFVPVLNLFGPVLAALAFIHFGLARLKVLRAPRPTQTPAEILRQH